MDPIEPAAPRLTFSGLASGLDSGAIVEALIEFERRPLTLLEARRSDLQSQQSLLRQLNTMLLDLRNAAQGLDNLGDTLTGPSASEELLAYTAASSDASVLEAEAGDGASVGTHRIEVGALAQVARRISVSLADSGAALSASNASFTVDFAGGQIALDLAAGTTLEDLATAINQDAANDGSVQASVIFDGSGYRLAVAGTQTGVSNDVTVTTDLSGGAFIETNQDASDAQLSYLGVAITRESNDVTDLIPGVTLRLRDAAPGSPIDVNVTRDDAAITARLQGLADAFNAIRDFSIRQSQVDPNTNLGGLLSGDSFVRGIESSLQLVTGGLYAFADNPLRSLGQIGLAFDDDGKLQLDEAVLTAALDDDPLAVRELLSGDGASDGVAAALARTLEPLVRSGDGSLTLRDASFDGRIDDLDRQIERFEFRLEKREETLRAQFSRLETLISSLQGQTSFLETLTRRSSE